MYQSLMYAVKRRMIDEIEQGFQNHPAFTEKVKVYHKFPYVERVQYGVVLRNTNASQIRLAADNYMSDSKSHVRLAKQSTFPGLSIEWARENSRDVTCWKRDEDVTFQVGPTQRMFRTSSQILSGAGNTVYADNIGQITVTLDGVKTLPEYVNGERGVVMLRRAPAAGVKVLVSYWQRKIVPPGIFVIDFIEDNQFTVQPIYIIKKEMVFETTTGTEVSAQLLNSNVYPMSDALLYKYKSSDVTNPLVRNVNYSIDYVTGVVTLLTPLPKGYQLFANYRWQPLNYINGPYDFLPYQENHTVVPGVVLSIGRRAQKGDQQAIIVSQFREDQAMIYGGHWTMSFDIAVIAKDPMQMEEMTDHLVHWLWGVRKNVLEFEGLTLNSVEPTGESEESYIETTGDMYYTSAVSVSLQSEWQEFVPYAYAIQDIVLSVEEYPGAKNYDVDHNLKVTIDSLQPDTRPVIVYPMIGYERLT